MYSIKTRPTGRSDLRFRFVAPGGKTTMLRVHASRFNREQVTLALRELRDLNPEHEFETRPVERATSRACRAEWAKRSVALVEEIAAIEGHHTAWQSVERGARKRQ